MAQQISSKAKGKVAWIIAIIAVILLIAVVGFFVLLFIIFSLAGAQGQPATIIPPSSKGASSGNSIPIPENLTAQTDEESVSLSWDKIQTNDFKEYKVYRSMQPGKKYALIKTVEDNSPVYTDTDILKGVTYYYVVTATNAGGAESGNSTQTFAIIESGPLVPKGVYSWGDVKAKIESDSNYLDLLKRVTPLDESDVRKLAAKEENGMDLKRTLSKGTVVTNSTKNYKILPNYILKEDRIALTDEDGNPYILTKCGNPMKLQVLITPVAKVVQTVQVFVTNVIINFPPAVTNVFINIGQAANDVTIAITPSGLDTIFGPTYAPPPPEVYIDPVDLGDDYPYPDGADSGLKDTQTEDHGDHGSMGEDNSSDATQGESGTDQNLGEGEQWIQEGQLMAIANPHDPAPGQSVTMTIRLASKKTGVQIKYSVSGTDGYKKSGDSSTDSNGEITFTIPGGKAGVSDTITASAPSEGFEGSTTYKF